MISLALITGCVGFLLILFGIWNIHEMKGKSFALLGPEFFKCPEYRIKRWFYTILPMLGLACIWGAAATTVPVVSSSHIDVTQVTSGRMEVTLEISKQRDCVLDSLLIYSEFTSGRKELVTVDYPPWLSPMRPTRLEQDTLETVVHRDDPSAVTSIGFTAKYTCPFGFHLESFLGEVIPPVEYNEALHEQN